MNKVNPAFILRNYLLQEAIEKAENGDFRMVNELFEHAKTPFTEPKNKKFAANPPKEAFEIRLSCSSWLIWSDIHTYTLYLQIN